MLSVWTVSIAVFCYLLLLFALAFWADRRFRDQQQHPFIYSLALGVHCTSWAFFGTTTQAAQYGWAFVPTYLGIILVFLFAHPILRRIALLCHQHQVSSLADFISLRYDKSHLLAALVTILCFIGVIPYIALQLDAVTQGISIVAGLDAGWSANIGLYVAALMALFAILFGTRSLNLTEKHPGLMLTIAFESIVKLVALTVVGLYVCYALFDGVLDLLGQAKLNPRSAKIVEADTAYWVFASHVLLGICSMFCLPRQFHINFVENNGSEELRTARWLFPLYLSAMSLFVLPIAIAGHIIFSGNPGDANYMSSDAYALALPLVNGNASISLIAFIGGLSAATSMVIVATLATGIMISNNLATPLWLKIQLKTMMQHNLTPRAILLIRRITVLVVMGVAFIYHQDISQSSPLVNSGIIAIALLSQTMPIIIGGLYWQKRNKIAAQIALVVGACCWCYWLLWPSIKASYYFDAIPSDLQLAQGFALSLLVNLSCFCLVSWFWPNQRHTVILDPQTSAFTALNKATKIANLLAITEKVLGKERHQSLLKQLPPNQHGAYASPKLLNSIEGELASQIGNVSARILLSAIAEKKDVALAELVELVEEANQTFHFNHEVLQSSVENIQQGISVLDSNLTLLAWNQRYIELFAYPNGFIHVGLPIDELLRFNAKRGLFGDSSDIEQEITKRIDYMRTGSRYKYVREQENGQVIEVNGSPLPGGGFVTTYSDITDYISIQQQLQQSKEQLESRVEQRTQELQGANVALDAARKEAELANESKTKFLAAAGHDLMQPFNAASLFAALLKEKAPNQELADMSQSLIQSLNSAEELLTALLDMTKLDSGALSVNRQAFFVDDLLRPLVNEFSLLAQQKGLTLHYLPSSLSIVSDKKLLRRVIQNLISNAIRYTQEGRILVAVKRQGQQCKIRVIDTGQGIPREHQQDVFKEFKQLDGHQNGQGLGLGLTIVERISGLLQHSVNLHSIVAKGSCFEVTVPRGTETWSPQKPDTKTSIDNSLLLQHKTVLVIENEPQTLDAITQLFSNWGATVCGASDLEHAILVCPDRPDLLFLDYHLDNELTGVQAARYLRHHWQNKHADLFIPGILSSADRSEQTRKEAIETSLHYLPKPIKTAALKRLIKQLAV
ncbi:MAG: hybrid sensor histidine kinase/response regulator [Paraglaciecola sp.]|uniref:PAS domain-containing hybrid sensor histidine kinase/response regulator n=1 Tax=Paraglaciecola sp. TaxID=1920173 RepID=UPI00273DBF3E|nr:PAS domain-containing hybrid sensor histidine kinase/response regulator [Paraglaciecola sp.]MDP5029117.1 hybrid sensor histidine kinase/response regulator [Paraglaciecola sp.]MDP5129430.1 hybrid sensor histidine kinase/response regulator [Paraglaciecola sp.]